MLLFTNIELYCIGLVLVIKLHGFDNPALASMFKSDYALLYPFAKGVVIKSEEYICAVAHVLQYLLDTSDIV